MGISYAVVTKVKELTEDKHYGEAFDLLQGEDIFQSLNPQFLRSCGKTYLETDHFAEAREALVKAHIMAPESTRIIYDLVHLYIKMGYYTRANNYYELYEHYTNDQDVGRLHLQYMLKKSQRVEAKDLLLILEQASEEEYSDEWGFEQALLYASLGLQQKCKEECIHLMASFKQSPYCSLADALKKGEYDVANSNFSFPLVEVEEDRTSKEDLIKLEEEQWKKDDLLIHPPEAVILQMEDDDETEDGSSGKNKKESSKKESSKKESSKKEKGFRLPFGHHKNKNIEFDIQTKERVDSDGLDSDGSNSDSQTSVIKSSVQSGLDGQSDIGINTDSDTADTEKKELSEKQTLIKEADHEKDGSLTKETPLTKETDNSLTEKEESNERSNAKMTDSTGTNVRSADLMTVNPESDVSSYIASVMQSVADIEASVAEELKNPVKYDTEIHRDSHRDDSSEGEQVSLYSNTSETEAVKDYQPRLNEVDGDLSPKERLEKLMRLIEEDRKKEEEKKPNIYQEEELDMDEYLMNLVGASSITNAMVKSYHEEQDRESQKTEMQESSD